MAWKKIRQDVYIALVFTFEELVLASWTSQSRLFMTRFHHIYCSAYSTVIQSSYIQQCIPLCSMTLGEDLGGTEWLRFVLQGA